MSPPAHMPRLCALRQAWMGRPEEGRSSSHIKQVGHQAYNTMCTPIQASATEESNRRPLVGTHPPRSKLKQGGREADAAGQGQAIVLLRGALRGLQLPGEAHGAGPDVHLG